MTVTLNFKPEIEAGLLVQAQASGNDSGRVPAFHGRGRRVPGSVA
jgi:hypothetical protein